MKNILARGGIEFLAVFLGIVLSFNVEEWREESEIKNNLFRDYVSIQKDLEKDIPYLERIISEHSEAYNNSTKLLQILDEEIAFDYNKFISMQKRVSAPNSFFGTKSAYDASVSSGRLTYFGMDSLANEIGKIYNHHYDRLELNGKHVDERSGEIVKINLGKRYKLPLVMQENIKKIKSDDFYVSLVPVNTGQKYFIIRANNALQQMKKVNKLLLNKISSSKWNASGINSLTKRGAFLFL